MNESLLLSLLFLRLSRGEFYLEVAVTSCSGNFIQSGHKNTHMLCFRRCLQTTEPLITTVKHTVGYSRKRRGWGCRTCATWGGDRVLFRVSPVLRGWVSGSSRLA